MVYGMSWLRKLFSVGGINPNPSAMLLGMLVLIAVVTIAPHAFAQKPDSYYVNNPDYTPADDPHGPLENTAIGTGIACAAVMTGVGIYTTRRRR